MKDLTVTQTLLKQITFLPSSKREDLSGRRKETNVAQDTNKITYFRRATI
jgi:hypothetical protein